MASTYLNVTTKKKSRSFFSLSLAILVLVAIICSLGLLFIFEASVGEAFSTFGDAYYLVKQQAMWLAIGTLALGIGRILPLAWLEKWSALIYGGAIFLLILVFIPGVGREFNGAHRWISIFNITVFQPVEFVKLAICLFFPAWLLKHQRLGPFLLLTALPTALLILQPDLGSTLLILGICVGLFFLSGGQFQVLLSILGMGFVFVLLATVSSPYRMRRVTTFLNPELDPLGASFHIRQITLALGRGGVWGQGIGNSQQRFNYIPEASTDSIFAITAEELGFVGSSFIISLYVLLITLLFKATKRVPAQTYAHLVASGVLIWITVQTILNLSAVVALVPLTGVPLPFFSYGGSALVMVLFATGILLNTQRTQ